jgi:hypothetical protein
VTKLLIFVFANGNLATYVALICKSLKWVAKVGENKMLYLQLSSLNFFNREGIKLPFGVIRNWKKSVLPP